MGIIIGEAWDRLTYFLKDLCYDMKCLLRAVLGGIRILKKQPGSVSKLGVLGD